MSIDATPKLPHLVPTSTSTSRSSPTEPPTHTRNNAAQIEEDRLARGLGRADRPAESRAGIRAMGQGRDRRRLALREGDAAAHEAD